MNYSNVCSPAEVFGFPFSKELESCCFVEQREKPLQDYMYGICIYNHN